MQSLTLSGPWRRPVGAWAKRRGDRALSERGGAPEDIVATPLVLATEIAANNFGPIQLERDVVTGPNGVSMP